MTFMGAQPRDRFFLYLAHRTRPSRTPPPLTSRDARRWAPTAT